MKITNKHLSLAIDMAVKAHLGMYDKGGMPYICHPLRVMNEVRSLGTSHMIIAVLHDTVEDTSITNGQVRELFGDEIAEAIRALTHKKNEPYKDYLKRVKDNHYARAVKFEDIHDNMRHERLSYLDEETRERLLAKYMRALLYL